MRIRAPWPSPSRCIRLVHGGMEGKLWFRALPKLYQHRSGSFQQPHWFCKGSMVCGRAGAAPGPCVGHQRSLPLPSGFGGTRPTPPRSSSAPRPAKGSSSPDGRIVPKIKAFVSCLQALRWRGPATGILPLAALGDTPANAVSQGVTFFSVMFCVQTTFCSGPGTPCLAQKSSGEMDAEHQHPGGRRCCSSAEHRKTTQHLCAHQFKEARKKVYIIL